MLYNGSVVGTTFEPAKTNIPILVDYLRTVTAASGEIEPSVSLKHNPLNPYDANAVEVHVGYGLTSYFVGHIPKTYNQKLLEAGLENLTPELNRFFIDDAGNAFGLSLFVYKNHQVLATDADKPHNNHVGV